MSKWENPLETIPPLTQEESTALFADFVRRHQLAVNDLTESQLAEALRQAAPDFRRYVQADKQQVVYLPWSEAERWKALYHELLFAVETKHDWETRHETALRYIQEAERGSDEACSANKEISK